MIAKHKTKIVMQSADTTPRARVTAEPRFDKPHSGKLVDAFAILGLARNYLISLTSAQMATETRRSTCQRSLALIRRLQSGCWLRQIWYRQVETCCLVIHLLPGAVQALEGGRGESSRQFSPVARSHTRLHHQQNRPQALRLHSLLLSTLRQ